MDDRSKQFYRDCGQAYTVYKIHEMSNTLKEANGMVAQQLSDARERDTRHQQDRMEDYERFEELQDQHNAEMTEMFDRLAEMQYLS